MKKRDLILASVLLLAAAALWFAVRPGGSGGWVVVTCGGEEIARYSLVEDRTVTLGEEDYNVLVISNGKAVVTEANCGDHTCIRMGEICREGETIVCLPHRLVISIVGGGDAAFDAVAG